MFVMLVLVFMLRPSYKVYRKGFMRMRVLPNRLMRVTKLGVPIAIPAGYILGFPLGMGIEGIWLAYPIGFVFSVILLGIRARKKMSHTIR